MNLLLPLAFWIACVAAGSWLARKRGKPGLPWAAFAGWLVLPVYNAWLKSGCPGDCGIRVDLLLVGPALLALTTAAVLGWFSRRREKAKGARSRRAS